MARDNGPPRWRITEVSNIDQNSLSGRLAISNDGDDVGLSVSVPIKLKCDTAQGTPFSPRPHVNPIRIAAMPIL
jgi:hypothetical protein